MSKLIMLKGLPRSGKSTWAKEFVKNSGNAVIVSRDSLREMLHNNKWSRKNEEITMFAQKSLVEALLKKVQCVLIDDTNLGEYHKSRWQGVASAAGASFEIHEEKTSDIRVLIARDDMSNTRRGDDVIIKLALEHKYIKYADDEIVICDLDGTLCDIEHRKHFVSQEVKDWHSFFKGCTNDTLRENVLSMLLNFSAQGKKIFFVSGRPNAYRKLTTDWLADKNIRLAYRPYTKDSTDIIYEALLMRNDSDTRPDTIVKQEILDTYFDKKSIHCCIDDRPSVIRMWQSNNLLVHDVGKGEEF